MKIVKKKMLIDLAHILPLYVQIYVYTYIYLFIFICVYTHTQHEQTRMSMLCDQVMVPTIRLNC